MKVPASLTLIAPLAFMIAFVPLQPGSAQQGGQTRAGNVTGVVTQETQKDEDLSVKMDFRSDLPFDRLSIPEFKNRIPLEEWRLPKDWNLTQGEQGTVISGPPIKHFLGRFDFPKELSDAIKAALEKGVLTVDLSLGGLAFGSWTFEVKKVDPPKPVSLNDVAHVPETIRIGNSFSVTLKEGYTDGDLKLQIGDRSISSSTQPLVNVSGEGRTIGLPLDRDINRLLSTPPTARNDDKDDFSDLVDDDDPPPTKTFLIPPETNVNGATLVYSGPFGELVTSGKLNVLPDPFAGKALPPPKLIKCTPKIFASNTLCVCGFFPDEFSRRALLLDGKPIGGPLAGAIDMVTVKPAVAPGRHVITWNLTPFDVLQAIAGGRQLPSAADKVEFELLEVQASIDQNALVKRQKTKLQIRVIGTKEKLPVRLVNNTPNIIKMDGGDKLMTSGGDDNRLEREVTGLQAGNFDIFYELNVGPCPCEFLDISPEKVLAALTARPYIPPARETPPEDPAIIEKREECSELSRECAALEYSFDYLTYGRRSAVDKCKKDANPPLCEKVLTAYFDEKLPKAEKDLIDCRNRARPCFIALGELIITLLDASNPPKNDVECNAIRQDYEGLKALVDRLIDQRQQALDACAKSAGDPQRREACQAGVNRLLSKRIDYEEDRSRDRLAAYKRCLQNRKP